MEIFSSLKEFYKKYPEILISSITSLIFFVFSIITNSYGKDILGQYYSAITSAFMLIAIITLIISYYYIYKNDLESLIWIASGIILLISVIVVFLTRDSNYLIAGFSLILVFVTSYYAGIMKDQLKLSEKEKRGRNISEISQLIFSPMYNDLFSYYYSLRKGNFFSVNPIKTRVEENRTPNNRLKEYVLITNQPYQMYRPAKILLSYPDPILQRSLPRIQRVCDEFDLAHNQMKENLNSVYSKKSVIWANFKEYCEELDPTLNELSLTTDDFNLIFNHSILQNPPETLGISKLHEFIKENQMTLLNWLKISLIRDEITKYLDSKIHFEEVVKKLIREIEQLYRSWRIEYYLLQNELFFYCDIADFVDLYKEIFEE